jgi:hypothetical protein
MTRVTNWLFPLDASRSSLLKGPFHDSAFPKGRPRTTTGLRPTVTMMAVAFLLVCLIRGPVRADESPPTAIMIQTGTKGCMFASMLISRVFDSVSFQFFDISKQDSPGKVKLNVARSFSLGGLTRIRLHLESISCSYALKAARCQSRFTAAAGGTWHAR